MYRALAILQRSALALPAVSIGLIPILAVPFISVPIEIQKGILLAFTLGLTLIILSPIVARDGFRAAWLRTPIGIAFSGFAILSLCAGVARSESAWQLFGIGFEVGAATFPLLLVFACAYGVSAGIADTLRTVYMWVAAVSLASLFALGSYVLSPEGSGFTILIGEWTQLSIAIGLSLCFILARLDASSALRPPLTFLAVLLTVLFVFFLQREALIVCALISGLFALFVYVRCRRVALFSLIGVVVFTILFFGVKSSVLDMPPTIRMSAFLNEVVASSVFLPLSGESVFGVGPGQFSRAWESARPIEFNTGAFAENAFWNGYSMVGTLAVELGFLGIVAYLLISCMVLMRLLSSARHRGGDVDDVHLLLFVGLGVFIAGIFYPLHAPLVVIAACALGGASTVEGVPVYTRVRYIASVVLFVAGALCIWIVFSQLTASRMYVKGLVLSEEGLHKDAAALLTQAVDRWPSDLYARDASRALAQTAFNSAGISAFSALIARSVTLSDASIDASPHNYWNWISRAGLMVSLVRAGFQEVRPEAEEALRQAHSLSPSRVEPLYLSAVYAHAVGNTEQAARYLDEALLLKSDYEPALVLKKELSATLSQ